MPKLEFNPTGTGMLESQLAVGIRKIFRNRLKHILNQIKKNQVNIERLIRTEATLGVDAIDIITSGLNHISEEIRPLLFGTLMMSWRKSNIDANKVFGGIPQPISPGVLKALQSNSLGFIKKLSAQKKSELRSILTDGVTQGDSIPDIAKEVKDSFKTTSFRSEAIARTEVVRTYNVSALETMKHAGIDEYEWKASLDDRTRKRHRKLNGQKFKVSDASKGKAPIPTFIRDSNGKLIPSENINCRCRTIPLVSIQ